jgi:hypothetical protein
MTSDGRGGHETGPEIRVAGFGAVQVLEVQAVATAGPAAGGGSEVHGMGVDPAVRADACEHGFQHLRAARFRDRISWTSRM